MKVISYNIRSWYRDIKAGPRNWRLRAADIKALLTKEQPDVILLQEALPPMTAKCIPEGYTKASGCSISHHIFIRNGFAEIEGKEWHIHWTMARLRLHDATRWDVVSVHGHWDEGKTARLADDLNALIKSNAWGILIGGDWNNIPADMRRLLWPGYLLYSAGTTFKNWETGKRAVLDYFAMDMPTQAEATLVPNCSWQDSDHLPVMITI